MVSCNIILRETNIIELFPLIMITVTKDKDHENKGSHVKICNALILNKFFSLVT